MAYSKVEKEPMLKVLQIIEIIFKKYFNPWDDPVCGSLWFIFVSDTSNLEKTYYVAFSPKVIIFILSCKNRIFILLFIQMVSGKFM